MSFQSIKTPTLDPYEPPPFKRDEPIIGPIGLIPVLLIALGLFIGFLCLWDQMRNRVLIEKNSQGQWERVR